MGGALQLENGQAAAQSWPSECPRLDATSPARRFALGTDLRLMLVDDHYLVRLGLSSVIALEADMRVCAEAATGHHAIELFRSINRTSR